MSYAARLVHTLTHVRTPLDDRASVRDEYGQPDQTTPVRTTIRGLVQPKNAREMFDARDAGTVLADHVIFVQPMELHGSDFFEYGGERYDITAIRTFAFGTSPHIEVDAKRIASTLPAGSTADEVGS